MPEDHHLVVYCLLEPAAAGVLEDLRAYYREHDARVEVKIDRRVGQRRRTPVTEPRAEHRTGADRRRFAVPRMLKPLPADLAKRAGNVRWLQRMMPVGPATDALTTDAVVEAVRRGDAEAPTELYWRSFERIHSRLCVLLGTPAEADRVVPVTFGRVLDALDDPARGLEPYDKLLYDLIDAAAEEAVGQRGTAVEVPDGGLAILDPELDEAVRVSEPDKEWAGNARSERERILSLVSDFVVALEHVGGTAIPGVAGRNTIDLMAGVHQLPLSPVAIEALEEAGYEACGDAGTPGRLYLRRRGKSRVDLHIVEFGGPLWDDTLQLREFLRRHPQEAQRWGTIKADAARRAPTSALRYYDLRRLMLDELLERARLAAVPNAA